MGTPDAGKRRPASLDTWTWDGRFRSIFDSAMDAVITMGIDGNVIDWNKRAEACFGWSREEAKGRVLAELIVPPRYRDAHREGLQRFLETGESRILNRRIELTALRKSGEEFPVELSITPVAIGAAVIFNAFVRDVSEQKRDAERRRRETLEARLLHHAATLSLSEQTFDDALRNCVATICEATGWEVGHVLIPDPRAGTLVSSIWHLSDPDRYAELRRVTEAAVFRPGVGVPGRIWESQKPVWVEDVCDDPAFLRLRDIADLNIKGVFGFPVVYGQEVAAVLEFFHHDTIRPDPALLIVVESVGKQLGTVVERRRWQEERNHLASIVESSNDAIIAKSLDGTILTWNRGAERIYGYTAAEVVGQTAAILIPDELQDEEPEIRDVARLGKRLEYFETRRRRKNGESIDVAITVSPVRNSEGRITGSSTIERDITMKNIRERELQVAKESAETANRIKGEFLANISHELRTPMNAILGMLELALGEKLSDVMADYLHTARESAIALLSLLNDLLDFSRIEAGRFALESAPFHLRDQLDGAMKMLSLRANEKGLELAYRIDANVPDRLSGDAMRLNQVVVNLVGNAINFTEQGEVVVDVSAATSSPSGDQVELKFEVADTGIGISEGDRERIFAPFTQADASSTRRYTGTGLGLAICRELVERMDGRLWVDSVPGEGSRFHFTARFTVLPEDEAQSSKRSRFVEQLRGQRVLVVDDNATNRRILEETLRQWEIRPTVAADGATALDILKESSGEDAFAVLIVDALMPEMDGFMFIDEARRQQVLSGATILMLSSADRQTFHDRCDQSQVAGYLEKPVSRTDLLDAVLSALHGPVVELEVPNATAAAVPLRILLAEDTPANRKLVTIILNKRGHEVVPAGNGREAVELAYEREFDVVLMDVQMPTMDGFQATAAIRNMDGDIAGVPIIAMTAHALRGDRERCIAAGMDAYLSKPIDATQLVDTIERLTPRRSPRVKPANGSRRDKSRPKLPRGSRIDAKEAIERLGGDEQLYADLIVFFRDDAPRYVDSIRNGIEREDLGMIARHAHSLKGIAASLGDAGLSEAAAAVERAARDKHYALASSLFAAVESELGATLSELDRFSAATAGSSSTWSLSEN